MTTQRYFCIGDIHGDFLKLCRLMDILEREAGFDPTKDKLVSLGDKNDRGPKTFEVFDFFKIMMATYPGSVILILGNHEQMMMAAAMVHLVGDPKYLAESFWYPNNGGPTTLQSYEETTGLRAAPYTQIYSPYNRTGGAGPMFMNMLEQTGHWDMLKNQHELLHETNDYIFCHAPQKKYVSKDWRTNRANLLWTHGPHNEKWVEDNLGPGKIAVHGHIHGLSYKGQGQYNVKKVRRHGNTFLVDTGCGCAPIAPLSCLVLPDLTVYNSNGETYSLKTQEEIEIGRAEGKLEISPGPDVVGLDQEQVPSSNAP